MSDFSTPALLGGFFSRCKKRVVFP